MSTNKQQLELESFAEFCRTNQESIPYIFNILDEQCGHIIENSHTNILMKLLQYKNIYGYVFLKNFFSFLGLDIKVNLDQKVEFHKEKYYETNENKGRIDGLIFQKNQFAIIIENKVNGADNQKEQLKKYIKNVLRDESIFSNGKDEDNKKNLWVLFLTKDGIKKPDRESVNFLQDMGIYSSDNEDKEIKGARYAAINYQEHILPWLKEEIQPIIMQKEQTLNTGLLQYIDFLEGMLGLRQSDAELLNKGKEWVNNWLIENNIIENNIDISKEFKKVNDNLDFIRKDISKQLKKLEKKDIAEMRQYAGLLVNILDEINDEPMKDFFDITRKYFESNGLMDKCVISHIFNYYYIQIRDTSWPRSIHFEWYPLGLKKITSSKCKTFTFCFHVEGAKEIHESFMNNNKLVSYFKERKFFINEYSRQLSFFNDIDADSDNPFFNNDKLLKYLEKVYSYVTPELIGMINEQIKKIKP